MYIVEYINLFVLIYPNRSIVNENEILTLYNKAFYINNVLFYSTYLTMGIEHM